MSKIFTAKDFPNLVFVGEDIFPLECDISEEKLEKIGEEASAVGERHRAQVSTFRTLYGSTESGRVSGTVENKSNIPKDK